jgi:uncharacterized protein (TIGR02145 family)
MNKVITILQLLLSLEIGAVAQNVGIGTTTPASSAQLDVSSTSKGFLPPRMTQEQRDIIANPVAGLIIFCTNCCSNGEWQGYNGNAWINMTGCASSPSPTNVTICSQVWISKNLDVATYRNGDPIPKVTNYAEWYALKTGAYCYYNNDSATYAAVFGKLYNWYAVNDSRGLAPAGWHVPSDAEWTTLSNCLGGYLIAGGKMKSIGTLEAGTGLWVSPNTDATNSSGFNGLPAGIRIATLAIDGSSINRSAYWWSSTNYSTDRAWSRQVMFNSSILDWGIGSPSGEPPFVKYQGMSVRCIKDDIPPTSPYR